MELIFTVLYGLSLIGGLFLAWVWGRVAWRASCRPRLGERFDQFCLIAIGLCAGAVGNVAIFGTRTLSAALYGIDQAILDQPYVFGVLTGLMVLAVSKAILMWAYDPEHSSPAWRWFAGLSILWVMSAPLLLWVI